VLARIWRKMNQHALLVGIQTDAAIVENSMEVPREREKEHERGEIRGRS